MSYKETIFIAYTWSAFKRGKKSRENNDEREFN